MGEIMMCGVDCTKENGRCNGYCDDQSVPAPPDATPEMVLARKKQRAFDRLREAETAWHEYSVACELGDERVYAAEVFDRVRCAPRR